MMEVVPARNQFELDGDVLDLLDRGGGQYTWNIDPQPGQPGDSKQVKATPLEMHAGFGASRRIRRGNGTQSDAGHHAEASNVSAQFEGLTYPAPRVTYLTMHTLANRSRGFRVGGYSNSKVGGEGAGIGSVGGGQFGDSPWLIREFNGSLYAHCGKFTFTIDPDQATPTAAAVRDHGSGARARSSDVFGNQLGVAVGLGVGADWLVGSTPAIPEVTAAEQTFEYTTVDDLTIPAGVATVTVVVEGAQGASSSGIDGGQGARVTATVAVVEGDVLYMHPGTEGGGAGAGGASTGGYPGYAGGSSSDVRLNADALGDRIIIAGAGGGAGGYVPAAVGGAGGLTGADGADGFSGAGAGQGATGAAPGAGGTGTAGTNGAAGSGNDGGDGGGGDPPGGGGGGDGYFGGGGGEGGSLPDDEYTAAAGGGGGSSWVDDAEVDDPVYASGQRSGDGRIVVTFTPVTQAAVPSGGEGWEHGEFAADVYKTGVAGRLFAAAGEKVYNVLPGLDPLLTINYTPSNGEVITEVSDPVRSLVEWSSALVAGTARTVRTLDPNRGYQGVSLVYNSRRSASAFDGRAMIAIGSILLHATTQAVYLLVPGRQPVVVGPEVMHQNETSHNAPQWGVPDFMGEWIAWPAYYPDEGHSVIFFARMRDQGDIGTGAIAWADVLHLEDREVRSVLYWGGSATRKPRLFFGAGTTDLPFQVGWCDLGRGGGPDPFTTDGQPAEDGFIETPLDDLGAPGVRKVAERVEIPNLRRADLDNWVRVSVKSGDEGELFTDMLPAEVTTSGFARVGADPDNVVSGVELAVRFDFHQATDAQAADWLLMHGTPMLYYTEIPDTVDTIDTLVDAKTTNLEVAQGIADRLVALMIAPMVRQRYGPDGKDRYVHVVSAKVVQREADNRLAIALVMREVLA